MREVSPEGQTYKRCKDRASQAYTSWAYNNGYFPHPMVIHHRISLLLTPTLIDEHKGYGTWLIPHHEDLESGTTGLADIMAYNLMLLEEHWKIVWVEKGRHQGSLLVAGPLSGDELSDLTKGFFPQSLSFLGIPGPGFRTSIQTHKTNHEVEPTFISGTENTQHKQNEGGPSLSTRRGCPSPRIPLILPPTWSLLPVRRAFSEPSLSSLAASPRQQPRSENFPINEELMEDLLDWEPSIEVY